MCPSGLCVAHRATVHEHSCSCCCLNCRRNIFRHVRPTRKTGDSHVDHRDARRQCRPRNVVPQTQLAPVATPVRLLRLRLSGSHQRRLCQTADAKRPRAVRRRLRCRRRCVFSGVCAVRATQQPHAASSRGAKNLQSHSGVMGHHIGLHALRA
ncbi:hypothetical protein D3C76_1251960 [compost metagenome]